MGRYAFGAALDAAIAADDGASAIKLSKQMSVEQREDVLFAAVRHESVHVVAALLEDGVSPDARESAEATYSNDGPDDDYGSIVIAMRLFDTHTLLVLLRHGANANAATYFKQSAIGVAVSEGNYPAYLALRAFDAHPTVMRPIFRGRADSGLNHAHRRIDLLAEVAPAAPIFHAYRLHLAQRDELLARPPAETPARQAAAMYATLWGDIPLLQALKVNAKDLTKADADGFLPIHNAAYTKKIKVVRTLLKAGADVNARGPGGVTPLMIAADNGSVYAENVTQFLLDAGADAKLKDDEGRDAYDRIPEETDAAVKNPLYLAVTS